MRRKERNTAVKWETEAYMIAQAEAQSVPPLFYYPICFRAFNGAYLLIIGGVEPVVRAAQRSMWQYGTDIELPADYKKRHNVVEVQAKVEDDATTSRRSQQRTLSAKNKSAFCAGFSGE